MPPRSHIYYPVLLLTCLLVTGAAVGQERSPPALDPGLALTQYVHDNWQVEDGLPQNTVSAIVQAPNGYLWIGTEEGLARFDGSRFSIFDARNTPALVGSQSIRALAVDGNGTLWIGTEEGGLVGYLEGSFFRKQLGADSSYKHISTLSVSPTDGSLWVGTTGNGVFRVGPDEDAIDTYGIAEGLPDAQVRSIHCGPDGTVWVGTNSGLSRVIAGQVERVETANGDETITTVFAASNGQTWIGTRSDIQVLENGSLSLITGGDVLSGGVLLSIWEAPTGQLWFGTDRDGVLRLSDGHFQSLTTEGGLSHNRVIAIHGDREGSLWIGTEGGGLTQLRNGKFTLYGVPEGMSSDMVLSIHEGQDGSMWFGTEGGALNRLQDGEIEVFDQRNGLPDDVITSILSDRTGDVWIGTYFGGLARYDGTRFHTYGRRQGLPGGAVAALYEARDGTLWVGTDGGLSIRDGEYFRSLPDSIGIGSQIVTAIHEGQDGAFWFGAFDGGLFRLSEGVLTHFSKEEGFVRSGVLSLAEDNDGTLWIGTYGHGLYRYRDGQFMQFARQQGIPSNNVFQILDDGIGHLWLTSNKGLSRLSKNELDEVAAGSRVTVEPTIFDRGDGLRSAEFNGGFQPAGWKSRDGSLWFPTIRGVASIEPNELRANVIPPLVAIEEMRVDGKAVNTFEAAAASIPIGPGAEKFEFDVGLLTFVEPDDATAEYRLAGYEDEWNLLAQSRSISYGNLRPGDYTLLVRGKNADGVASEDLASVSFVLEPFFYQTRLFWIFVISALLFAMLVAHRIRVRAITSRQAARQEELERLVNVRTVDLLQAKDRIESQAQRLQELNRFKSRFFNNISHELRTPLTLTIGPLQEALSGTWGAISTDLQRQIEVILGNSRRLLRLINQLLDLAKLESGRMTLRASKRDISDFVKHVVDAFRPHAASRRIKLAISDDLSDSSLFFERDKMENVLFNLLSNAIKFSKEHSTVTVRLTERAGWVDIQVADEGPGISKSAITHIFDRYYQAEEGTKSSQGTGIGLSLVKELVELHRGQVSVESVPGSGSVFTVSMLRGSSHLADSDIVPVNTDVQWSAASTPSTAPSATDWFEDRSSGTSENTSAAPDAPSVLVVEDNEKVRAYVIEVLSPGYRVAEAPDGGAGLDAVKENPPDLIILDLMMPKVDGYQMFKALRSQESTRHIPVIMLTARASDEMRLEGLAMGADDYLTKPFNPKELLVRVRNLIELRQKEQELRLLNEHLEEKVRAQVQVILSERRQYEQQLIHARDEAEDAERLKSTILTNLSHEIRTPITAILGFSEVLLERLVGEEEEFARYIERNGYRLLETVTAIIDLSKLESKAIAPVFETTAIDQAVQKVVRSFSGLAAEKELSIEVSLSSSQELEVEIDPHLVERILSVLISNAVKFTEYGGVTVGAYRDGNELVIQVTDTGIGISPDFLSDLFVAFRQESTGEGRRFEGSGLGLTVANRLVRLMGGSIDVKSMPGSGSTFTVRFPVSPTSRKTRVDRPATHQLPAHKDSRHSTDEREST